jgi:DnaJ domain/Mitochondrial carrier protein
MDSEDGGAFPPPRMTPVKQKPSASWGGRHYALYECLGLEHKMDATSDEIRAAYRRLARTTHPDKNASEDSHRRFQELQEAYDILSDPQKRVMYDALGDEAFWEMHSGGTDFSLHHTVWVLSKNWFFGVCTAPFDTRSVLAKANFGAARPETLAPLRWGGSSLWAGEGYRIGKGLLHTQVSNGVARFLGLSPQWCAWVALVVAYPLEVFQVASQSQSVPQDGTVFSLGKRLFALGGVRTLYSGLFPWMFQQAAFMKMCQITETGTLFTGLSRRINRAIIGDRAPRESPIREMVAGLTITVLKVAAVWALVTPVKAIVVRAQTAPLRGGTGQQFWSPDALARAGGVRKLYSGFFWDVGFQLASILAGGLMG